jgi:hypothetical protein
MPLQRRHKYILWSLGIYWPALFLLTHIPVPEIAGQSGMSDKMMHLLAYLILVTFVWLAISPYEKVRWNRAKVWLVLAVIVWYGATDEWLQGRVGRQPELLDFVNDLAGALIGLGILTMLSFWPAMLTLSAIFIFVIADRSLLLNLYPQWHLNTAFHLTAYATLALLWIQSLDQRFEFRQKLRIWPLVAIALPLGLLTAVKLIGWYQYHKPIWWVDIATAVFGIAVTVLVCYLTSLLAIKKQKAGNAGVNFDF